MPVTFTSELTPAVPFSGEMDSTDGACRYSYITAFIEKSTPLIDTSTATDPSTSEGARHCNSYLLTYEAGTSVKPKRHWSPDAKAKLRPRTRTFVPPDTTPIAGSTDLTTVAG